jgi:formate dehydrogenase maturation protein FdhE
MEISERELAFRSGLIAYVPIRCAHCDKPCRTLWRTDMQDVTPTDSCSECNNYFDAMRLRTHDDFPTKLGNLESKPVID